MIIFITIYLQIIFLIVYKYRKIVKNACYNFPEPGVIKMS